MGTERFSAVPQCSMVLYLLPRKPPNDISPLGGRASGERTMRTFILAAAAALSLSAAPAFAAGGYAFQDPLPNQAGEHVAGNVTLNGQGPAAERADGQQQLQINAVHSQALGTYLWAPAQGNGD
jgi:hypothetical protein